MIMMKLFRRNTWHDKVLGAAVLLCAGLIGYAATLEWAPNAASDNVQMYVLEHRATTQTNWTRVEIAGTTNRVVIPETAFGRWFRISAVNSFGQSEWTSPVKLPEKITGLKLILEITP